MTDDEDTINSRRRSPDDARRLERSLDRAVLLARVAAACGIAGWLAAASALAVVAVSALRMLGMSVPFPAGIVAVAGAIAVAVWRLHRRWRWPDRLATAMAIEAADPSIGERISRAVGFLDEPSDDPDSARAVLVRRAVTEASTAVEASRGNRSWAAVLRGAFARGPSTRGPNRFAAAGLAAGIVITVAAMLAPDRLLRAVAEPFVGPWLTETIPRPVAGEPPTIVPEAAVAAAARLAEAAAVEERLAVALLARFARLPGGLREELPRHEQDWLDETAAVQAAIADDIGRDLATVVVAIGRMHSRLAADLAGGGLVRERTATLASAAGRIRENQLAAAAGLITSQIRPMLTTLQACGVVPTGKNGLAFDRSELVRRRILAAIEADAGRLPEAADETGSLSRAGEIDLAPADVGGREPAPSPRATTSSDRTAAAAGGSTSGGPGSGGTASRSGSPPGGVGGADPAGVVPAWERARQERPVEALTGDRSSAPPRYRRAVDDYYRRLWAVESPTKSRHEDRAQEAVP